MTQRSEHGGFVRSEIVLGADSPCDVAWLRNVAINNALHAYDSMTMVRVHDVLKTGAAGWGPAGDASTWGHAKMWGPFPLRMRADGTTCPLVVRIAGRKAAASNSDYALALMPFSSRLLYPPPPDADDLAVSTATASSTTVAWLTMSRATVRLSAESAQAVQFQVPIIDGGVPTTVRVTLATLHLWTKSADSNVTGRACYAREYIE